jgi:hypothetical protein
MPERVFRFRGVRLFQWILVLIAVACAGGAASIAAAVAADGAWPLLPVAAFMVAVGAFALVTAGRLPSSSLRVSATTTAVRFPGFVDAAFDNATIDRVKLTKWRAFPGGLGVRTDLRGMVALVYAGGPAVELVLREPLRVWLIPGIWRARARRLILTVETPDEVVAAYTGRLSAGGV